jgi:phage tail-like protein
MQRAAIERLLPSVFQRGITAGSPLAALLDLMESMHAPSETALAQLDQVFDARRTDERFVTMLVHWVNLEWLYPAQGVGSASLDWRPRLCPIPPGRLRELVSNAARLSQIRGTTRALVQFLEIATGAAPFTVEESVPDRYGAVIAFHVRVTAPREAQPQEPLIRLIVEQEKPAYVTWELAWA